jgi:hypothetical protein
LRDEQDEWEPRIGRRKAAEPDFGTAPTLEVQDETRTLVAARDERVGEADGLKEFQRAGLNGQCARLMCAIQRPVDNAKPNTERPKLRRNGQPGRPRTHDQDGNLTASLPGVAIGGWVWFHRFGEWKLAFTG